MEVKKLLLSLVLIVFKSEKVEPAEAGNDGMTVQQMFGSVPKTECLAGDADGQCSKNFDAAHSMKSNKVQFGPRFQKIHLELPKINPVRTGYVRNIDITDTKSHEMKTLSVHPPVFDECEALIYLAKEKGVKQPPPVAKDIGFSAENNHSLFDNWDEDLDGSLSFTEISRIKEIQHLLLDEEQILKMYAALGIKADHKGHASYGELARVTFTKFRDYLQGLSEMKAMAAINQTEQTWMWHDEDGLLVFDDVFQNYHQRLSNLTRIPKELIEESEPLQVTRFKNGSFTECRHDSDPFVPEIPCCVYGSTSHCRACRFVSVMYFLNDVEDGELLFPLANNKTFLWDNLHADTTKICSKAPNPSLSNLVIKPKKGTAIMWYNHYIGRGTGWMSTLDPMSFYGANYVRNNDKWVATTWVNILGDGVNELRPWRMGTNWLSSNNKRKDLIELMRNDDFIEGEPYSHDAKLTVVDENETAVEELKEANDSGGSVKDSSSQADSGNPSLPLPSITAASTAKEGSSETTLKNDKLQSKEDELKLATSKGKHSSSNDIKESLQKTSEKEKMEKERSAVHGSKMINKKSGKKDVNKESKKINRNRSPEKGEGPLGPPLRGQSISKNEAPVGPRVEDTLPFVTPSGKMVENKMVVSILMLIDELSRDELEIIARSLHERLQLACIPIMVNPIGPM